MASHVFGLVRLRRLLLGLAMLALATCGADETRYSGTEFGRGVAVDVDDPAGAVTRAEVFLPDEAAPWHQSIFPRLDQVGLVVLQPGEEGYDVVVVYTAGPYCGLLPSVLVEGDATSLSMTISSRRAGECDDMGSHEAVGFDLANGFEEAGVTATRSG